MSQTGDSAYPEEALPRNPERLTRHDSGLLVVDVQEKLVPAIVEHEQLVWNIRRLLDGARLFEIPCWGTEQYPAGLGPTVSSLAERLGEIPAKKQFSACGCASLPASWSESGIQKIVVAGIEAHVCILQTVLDLLAAGFQVQIVVDAVASRHPVDYQTALRRMESQGGVLTTVETVLFEWCESADDPRFKQLSALVRETPPTESC
jgi:nicotinamidase-related amidase